MSTKREPLLSDEERRSEEYWSSANGRAVKRWPADKSYDGRTNLTLTKRNIRQGYSRCIVELVEPLEAARAKDAELIQQLVDALALPMVSVEADHRHLKQGQAAIAAAKAAGFTPSEQ